MKASVPGTIHTLCILHNKGKYPEITTTPHATTHITVI